MIKQVQSVKEILETAVRNHWSAHALNTAIVNTRGQDKAWGEQVCQAVMENGAVVSFTEDGKRVFLRVVNGKVEDVIGMPPRSPA